MSLRLYGQIAPRNKSQLHFAVGRDVVQWRDISERMGARVISYKDAERRTQNAERRTQNY